MKMALPDQQRLQGEIWGPQPGPQTFLLSCCIEDIFIGGARGGGKTIGLLLDWASHADLYGKHAKGIFFRRTYPELEEVEVEAKMIFPGMGASLHTMRRTWVWPNGATLRMRYLSRDEDADHYQGHSYTSIFFDELGMYPSLKAVDKLRACLRSAAGVPCVFRCSGNPGGPGHNQVKTRYIDPAPPLTPFCATTKLPDGTEARTWRVFIPATLDDNLKLQKADPEYWQRVSTAVAGNEALLKAWRWGIWDIVAGGIFDDLWDPSLHILSPFKIPRSWRVYRAFDWGSSKPFSVGWWAVSDGTPTAEGRKFPPGTLIRIAEWYGWNGKPNEGLRMVSSEIARKILEMEEAMGYKVFPGPADLPSAQDGADMAADFARLRVSWQEIDNKSRVAGWQQVRKRLLASKQTFLEDPGLFVFDTCRQFIRTVPILPRDTKNNDDVDSSAEDHCGDETRYMSMFRTKTGGSRNVGGI